jgi:asparagine synthase (glutamine-hydrolysing)
MCGIAGFLQTRHPFAEPELRAIGSRMGERITHRGPDEGDVWVDAEAGVSLSHRRLSIIDLSPAGHQPMASADGRYVVAFNGEIYNFADLRKELEVLGRVFRGHSDTEVLLEAVSAWGLLEATRRFNGMFAFALWDRQARALHLARDRFGEKPLYYAWVDGAFLFASELKALRAHPAFTAEVDRDALALFMELAYVPEPECIYRGTRKLPPASLLTVTADRAGSCRPAEYWSLRNTVEASLLDPFSGTTEEATEQLEVLLRDAVRLRMYADVPLGAFLSGGIDSSTVVALMQAQSSRPVKTFTIGFREDVFNEAQHARAVAKHLGTEHTELYLSARDALDVVPRLPVLYDEPFADPSQIPTFLVAGLARRHVTVSLSGDAGDELFGGYVRYAVTRSLWDRIRGIPAPLRRGVSAALRGAPGLAELLYGGVRRLLPAHLRFNNIRDKLQRLASVVGSDSPSGVYRELIGHWKCGDSPVLGSSGRDPRLDGLGGGAWDNRLVESMMFLDSVTYLPGDILAKVDRASMGVSLEARVPFLDTRVVEFAWRLPLEMKVRDGVGKWILREVLHRHVPRALVERPKMGFGVPVGDWLRGPLRSWAEDLLARDRLERQGFLRTDAVQTALRDHVAGRREHPYRLWNVLMFQTWLDALERS